MFILFTKKTSVRGCEGIHSCSIRNCNFKQKRRSQISALEALQWNISPVSCAKTVNDSPMEGESIYSVCESSLHNEASVS